MDLDLFIALLSSTPFNLPTSRVLTPVVKGKVVVLKEYVRVGLRPA
jgi:hypothetical protein